ncbi:hypothetical protein AX16_002595 [Volvariella volvacea WC 439]|nr:hypothetical protein AX16_002595 [Volvariella volvacea WC 439]
MSTSAPYDVNFCFPVPPVLENERVLLEPLVPSIHGNGYFQQSVGHPEIYTYLPYGPYASEEALNADLFEQKIRADPAAVLFAIFDKRRSNQSSGISDADPASGTAGGSIPGLPLAGLIAYINTSKENRATEIGCIKVLPPYQRTHVTSNAVGLLLHYALDGADCGGLGLRRVVWKANALNARSVRAAERMGFRREALFRWDRVLAVGKEAAGNGAATRAGCVGRDTVVLGLCWDDWVAGGRERVDGVMGRTG